LALNLHTSLTALPRETASFRCFFQLVPALGAFAPLLSLPILLATFSAFSTFASE
jgi:hypothetical protein